MWVSGESVGGRHGMGDRRDAGRPDALGGRGYRWRRDGRRRYAPPNGQRRARIPRRLDSGDGHCRAANTGGRVVCRSTTMRVSPVQWDARRMATDGALETSVLPGSRAGCGAERRHRRTPPPFHRCTRWSPRSAFRGGRAVRGSSLAGCIGPAGRRSARSAALHPCRVHPFCERESDGTRQRLATLARRRNPRSGV